MGVILYFDMAIQEISLIPILTIVRIRSRNNELINLYILYNTLQNYYNVLK